jgi:hypothetical protein
MVDVITVLVHNFSGNNDKYISPKSRTLTFRLPTGMNIPGLPTVDASILATNANDGLAMTKHISDFLIVVFVHGFKGTDETFGGFPDRLQHILAETISHVSVECLVFPAYEVR